MSEKNRKERRQKPTEMQKEWVRHFHNGGRKNGSEAARLAGYKGTPVTLANIAAKNKRNWWVKEELDRLSKKSARSTGITVHWKKTKLKEIIERGLKNKTDYMGNKVPVDLAAARAAIHELNLMDGDHQPAKVAVTTPVHVDMSPDLVDAVQSMINRL